MPAAWWLRPVSSAALVGEHSGVTWKFVNCTPSAARASMYGVSMSDPKQPSWANPVSSRRTTSTSGASAPGSGGGSNHGVDSASVRPIVPSNRSVRIGPPGRGLRARVATPEPPERRVRGRTVRDGAVEVPLI